MNLEIHWYESQGNAFSGPITRVGGEGGNKIDDFT
jgi:hypothetical protein